MKKNNKWIIIGAVIILALGIGGYFLYRSMTHVSKSKAKNIVIESTKLKKDDIEFTDIKQENDGNTEVYKVEFFYNDIGFTYTIDAKTGKVISNDFDDYGNYESPVKANSISEEEAKAMALKDASASEKHELTEQNVDFTKFDFDNKNGKAIYTLEFKSSIAKYTYIIDGAANRIVKGTGEELKK